MRDRGRFRRDYKHIKVEGFHQQTLLSKCAQSGIELRDIRFQDEVEMTCFINAYDLRKFYGLSKNRYQVTILNEKGYMPPIKAFFNKKSGVIGVIIFCCILYYQSLFISEIRIYGYEKNTEAQVRQSLEEAGLYEGCKKNIDMNKVKREMYNSLQNISWIGIGYVGNMVLVTISESEAFKQPPDTREPCHIVAKKNGYVEKITAREGLAAVKDGTYLKKGDIGITGICPISENAYVLSTPGAAKERKVHAAGTISAKVPYRFVFHVNKYQLVKKPTGKKIYGMDLQWGDFSFNTVEKISPWDSWVYQDKELVRIIRPIPLKISLAKGEEVTLEILEKDKKNLEKEANRILRGIIKENVPEKGQIINKSLKFTRKVNIIEVESLIEVIEEIGVEAKL
ncbi:MAG: sporulation protein YqfD [Anaerovorax sp.]